MIDKALMEAPWDRRRQPAAGDSESDGAKRPVRYLSVADVLQIQRDTIENEGGIEGVRDLGLLDSAVATPRQKLYDFDLHPGSAAKAAAYLYHIAMNHPFFDCNERAAAMNALVFLQVNGATLLPEPDSLEETTLAVAAGRISKADLTMWIQNRVE